MRMTKTRIASLALLLSAVATAGCGDITDLEADLTREILSGDWEATNVTITNIANPSQVVDLLEEGGAVEFRFNLAGDAIVFIEPPEGETVVLEGTYEFDESFIYLDFDGEITALAYDLQETQVANSLTMATTDFEYDFDGDGTPVPALFAFVIIR